MNELETQLYGEVLDLVNLMQPPDTEDSLGDESADLSA